jgi:hypothetical protein
MKALRIKKYSIGINTKAPLRLSPSVANAPLGGRPKGRVLRLLGSNLLDFFYKPFTFLMMFKNI